MSQRRRRKVGIKTPREIDRRVKAELAAMELITDALAALPDADSRARVLEWIASRYEADRTPGDSLPDSPPPAAAPAPVVERVLADLADLFESSIGMPGGRPEPAAMAPDSDGFAEDLARIASELARK